MRRLEPGLVSRCRRSVGLRRRVVHPSDAIAAYESVCAIFERLALENPTDKEFQRALAISLNELGTSSLETGNRDEALTSYRRGLEIQSQLARDTSTVASTTTPSRASMQTSVFCIATKVNGNRRSHRLACASRFETTCQ